MQNYELILNFKNFIIYSSDYVTSLLPQMLGKPCCLYSTWMFYINFNKKNLNVLYLLQEKMYKKKILGKYHKRNS